jgi:hypothetical protein
MLLENEKGIPFLTRSKTPMRRAETPDHFTGEKLKERDGIFRKSSQKVSMTLVGLVEIPMWHPAFRYLG